ncbi:MAG TPA: glycoside hydrolase family 99-like domain-containing protein [Roseiflexaceae bacterium]|nr:glycoside hydrolase family 99-like domain-containing protein [Roseiflexaceae bacterium]
MRPIAFYLPQFHPTPENDSWWGRGFTEWTNVAQARPLFPGHEQPHIPADLGFYDLRLAETRAAQADLARRYGIYGFCYYHYWFGGRRLLERPFDAVLESGQPDFPFCLCWANEDWTRAWDGRSGEYLIRQRYSAEDDRAHGRWLARAFADPRYIRVDGRPLFLVYRASRLPDARETTARWRDEARALGVGEIYLACVEGMAAERNNPHSMGFDAAVEFQPDWNNLGPPLRRDRLRRALWKLGLLRSPFQEHRVFRYADVVERMLAKPPAPYKRFPCVTPSWDNSPRRRRDAAVLHGSTPALYQRWLERVIARFMPPGPGEDLLFINAWNEWAEGAHLEPSLRWGHAYLKATREALRRGAGG